MSRKGSLAAGIARNLGFQAPAAPPTAGAKTVGQTERVNWEAGSRSRAASGAASAGKAKVEITLPDQVTEAITWTQSIHNVFHEFVATKGEPSLNLQREAAGYLSMAAVMCDAGNITIAQKERINDLVAQGNLQQSGRELFWLVLGDQAAAATPPLPDVRAQQSSSRRPTARSRGSSVGDAAEAVAAERGRKGSSAGSAPIVVAVSKTTDFKGNEMDQLHNPLFNGAAEGGGGDSGIVVQSAAPVQRARGNSVGGMSMYSKTGTAGRKKSSVGASARARAATAIEQPAGRGRSDSRLPIEQLRSLHRQDSEGPPPVYKRGEVECYFPSLARAGIKTWKESRLQLNKKSIQVFKMSDDVDAQGEKKVVKTRKEFELKNVDKICKMADAGSSEFFAFELTFKGSSQKPLPVRLPSEEERDAWFDAVQNNLDALWRFH